VLRSLHQPNEKLIELLLTCQTARQLCAQHLTLVAPYLAYMRQDMAFQAGEAISQQLVGGFLAQLVDAVVTVDPHLHRVTSLKQALPAAQALAISAAPLLSDVIAARRQAPLLMGPDEESRQWVTLAASRHQFEFGVCMKHRTGDQTVQITLPALTFSGRHVVLLDDVASTGQTLAQAAQALFAAGAATVAVAVTHALFAPGALERIKKTGVQDIWSTDSIPHASNVTHLALSLAEALVVINKNKDVRALGQNIS
jgi:ribose-phosphate pyrophosphokinase